jgi:hypothetical protein
MSGSVFPIWTPTAGLQAFERSMLYICQGIQRICHPGWAYSVHGAENSTEIYFFEDQIKTTILHRCCKMQSKPTIRALGSIFLLMTFSFSITPKIVLHNLVAHHKDIHPTNHSTSDQVAQAGYHCDCQSLVVVLPYLDLPAYIPQDAADRFLTFQVSTEDQVHSFGHFIFGFRGPPSAAYNI